MDKKNLGRKSAIMLVMTFVVLIIIGITMMTLRYPNRMKQMFVQSSLESMENKLNNSSVYINDNVSMNYEEIRLLAGLLSDKLDASGVLTEDALQTMQKTMNNAGFVNVGILNKNDPHLFATMADGTIIQLDTWVIALDYDESEVSVELQTSPFQSSDDGEDAVVYRYQFQAKDGTPYIVIAEKEQDTLNSMLNIESNANGLTLVMRSNGNVVYENGSINHDEAKNYNVYAMLQELGASEEQVKEFKTQIEEQKSGRFVFNVDGEPYYFMFHKIENTGWTCFNAYSETAMAGDNLQLVNRETIRLVIIVAGLLLFTLFCSLYVLQSGMKREGQRKVLETEHLFEEMSRHIPTAFAIIKENSVEPNFVSHNFNEVVGEDKFDFSSEGMLSWAQLERTEEGEKLFRQEEKYESIVCRDGHYYSFGIYYIGTINEKAHYSLVFNDITNEENAKHLLEDSMRRADEASKSKTQFLSKMSHEIRTPLNSVIGFSRLALDGWETTPNEELHDYVNKIQISGNYLLELVSDILDISRIEEGRMQINKQPCSLDAMVNEIVDSFQGQMARKNHQFVVEKNYKDIVLDMDSYHTKQILNNLISNSCKYTEDGGVVGFEITTNKLNEKQMAVQFVVQDTGIGMSPEFQEKIFEPFTQEDRGMMMKKQLRGSGLGMSICKNLVDLQNGTIKVESVQGEGSCFTVMLTYDIAEKAATEAVKKENEKKDYSCLKGKKILVVDDVEMNRTFIEKVLSMHGLTYEEAEDGKQALERFEKSVPDEFFAIFMDVNMPVMNGHEATEKIRKMDRPDAKEIMIAGMTADAFADDVNKALMSGMNYHISKPIQIERVLSVLMETYEKKAGKQND